MLQRSLNLNSETTSKLMIPDQISLTFWVRINLLMVEELNLEFRSQYNNALGPYKGGVDFILKKLRIRF